MFTLSQNRRDDRRRERQMITKMFLTVTGGLLTLIGALIFISPLPLGVFVVAAGLAMMIKGSTTCCTWIAHRRAVHERLNRFLSFLEDNSPHGIADLLRRTHPAE